MTAYSKDQIAKLAPGQYACGPGWFIDVVRLKDGTLARSYKFRFPKMRDGSRPELKIAGCEEWSYTRASKQAQEWRDMIRAGKDPRSVQQAIGGKTFKEFVEENIAGWSEGLNSREAYHWAWTLAKLPSLHKLPVAGITLEDVSKALLPIYRDKPVSADRIRRRVEKAFETAIRYSKIRTADNPARWADLKWAPAIATLHKQARKQKRHHPSVPYLELPGVMTTLRYEDAVSARCLELAILTGARSQEARLMEWDEIDLKRALWTIPAAKMKSRREHIVPLSRQAIALINAMPQVGKYVFASDHMFGVTDKALVAGALLYICESVAPGTVPHGMRSTFRDWATVNRIEEDWVLEECIAHETGTATVRAYRRDEVIERRRAVLQAWADYAMPPTNVVKLKVA